MSSKTTDSVQELITKFESLSQEMQTFVQDCAPAEWGKITTGEQWPIGVAARHIAGGHWGLIGLIKLIVDGEPLPELTFDAVHQGNAQHAADYADCTKAEVLELLQTNAAAAISYLQERNEEEMARTAYLNLFDSEVSASGLFTAFFIDSAQAHLQSMKDAIA
ncbi:MAG: DinB family protein [Caldilineaceae bacterium]|nr:DinB family protein [Caldilineaceae bacterium]